MRNHLAIFVSGSGTNCENLITYFAKRDTADVSLVVSSRKDAMALARAEKYGVPIAIVEKLKFADEAYVQGLLRQNDITHIILAGFLLKIPEYLIAAYPNRIINLHPALLPRYGGKGMYGRHVHEAVKASGDAETGMTVHYVNNEYDCGRIIAQYRTALSPADTVEDIMRKEHELEMRYFPLVVENVITTNPNL